MNITWYGYSCLKLEESTRDSEAALVIDPFEADGKIKLPRSLSADLVVSSLDDARSRDFASVQNCKFFITGPGEYELKDIFVTGFTIDRAKAPGKLSQGTIWSIVMGGIRVVNVAAATGPLSDKILEEISSTDILLVPVGGELKAKAAHEIVDQIEPRMVIPINFKSGIIGADLDGPELFIKLMGGGKPEVLPKFKLSPKDVPQEETKLIILEAQ